MTNEEYLAFFNTGKPQEPKELSVKADYNDMSDEDKINQLFKLDVKANMRIHFRPLSSRKEGFYFTDYVFFIDKKKKHRSMDIPKGARLSSPLNIGEKCPIKFIENLLLRDKLFKVGKGEGENGHNNYGYSNGLTLSSSVLFHAWVYSVTINGVKIEVNKLKLMNTSFAVANNILTLCKDIHEKESINAMCPISGMDFYIEKDAKQNRYNVTTAAKANNFIPVHPDLVQDGKVDPSVLNDLIISKWLIKDSDEYKTKYVKSPSPSDMDTIFNIVVPYIISQLHNRWSEFLKAPINTKGLIKVVEDTFGRKINPDNLDIKKQDASAVNSAVSSYLQNDKDAIARAMEADQSLGNFPKDELSEPPF